MKIFAGALNPCRLLYRTEHWNIPDYYPWGVPLAYLYFNRFAELLVHKPGEGFFLSLLATILSPLVQLHRLTNMCLKYRINSRLIKLYIINYCLIFGQKWGFSKFVETYVNQKLSLAKFGMVPEQSFHKDISSCLISSMPEEFYDRVEKGSIILKKAPKFSFCKEGILVEGEASPLESDLVILATGFKGDEKLRDIFVSPTFQNHIIGSPDASIPLFRLA